MFVPTFVEHFKVIKINIFILKWKSWILLELSSGF